MNENRFSDYHLNNLDLFCSFLWKRRMLFLSFQVVREFVRVNLLVYGQFDHIYHNKTLLWRCLVFETFYKSYYYGTTTFIFQNGNLSENASETFETCCHVAVCLYTAKIRECYAEARTMICRNCLNCILSTSTCKFQEMNQVFANESLLLCNCVLPFICYLTVR